MNQNKETCLYLVVPCYNEEEIIESSNRQLIAKMQEMMQTKLISTDSRILYVDDGSKDGTWKIIKKICAKSTAMATAIRLSRNEGHQNALMAGMVTAYKYADAVITIDADLQQDISVLDEFIRKYLGGVDIVFGIRNSRKEDGIFKKISALLFYTLMKWFAKDTIPNHADYRLLSHDAMTALFEYRETQLFLRGIIASMGFDTDIVKFDVKKRQAGKTKYSISKMLTLAVNGITSLSIKPIHLVFGMGMVALAVSAGMIIYDISIYIRGIAVPGWTSQLCSIWLLGGLILISIGIVGEYIGKTYMESKRRPLWFIREVLNLDE